MQTSQWSQLRSVFDRVASLPRDQQLGAARAACAGDSPLHDALLELLESDAKGFLDSWDPAEAIGLRTPAGDAASNGMGAPGAGKGAGSPERLGPYVIQSVLGRGRAGTVYRARHRDVARDIALKVLAPSDGSAPARARFSREVAALARLRHTGIAQIHSAEVLTDQSGRACPAICMELVEGEWITTFANSHNLSVRDRLGLVLQVAAAVAHAHRNGVIHRDLKPANVLVEGTPAGPCVKVVDFGIARLTGEGASQATMMGQVFGTLAYMAPEQCGAAMRGEVDTRCDVYAIGAIFFELLAGRPPLAADSLTPIQAMRALCDEQPPALGTLNRACRGDLEIIAGKALAKDAAERYQTAEALAADITRHLESRPIEARPAGALDTIVKFSRRHKGLSIGIGVAAVTLLVSYAGLALARQETEAARRESHDAASMLLNEVAEKLAGRIGAAAERKAILERMLPDVRKFAARYPLDQSLQRDYAKLLGALGDALQEEGRDADALVHLRDAQEIRRNLARINGDDPEEQAMWSLSLVRVGDALGGLKDLAGAQRAYLEALELDERLAARWPEHRRILDNLCFSYERNAYRAYNIGRSFDAERFAWAQLRTAERLYSLYPDHRSSIWAILSAHCQVAEILNLNGRTRLGTDHRLEALPYLVHLCALEPDRRDNRKKLLGLMISLTADLSGAIPPEERIRLTREAVGMAESLRDADPADVYAHVTVIRGKLAVASAEGVVGGPGRALATIQGTRALLQQLSSVCGDCPISREVGAQVDQAESAVRVEMGDRDSAAALSARAVDIYRSLYADDATPWGMRWIRGSLLMKIDPTPGDIAELVQLSRRIAAISEEQPFADHIALARALEMAGDRAGAGAVLDKILAGLPADHDEARGMVESVRLDVVGRGN